MSVKEQNWPHTIESPAVLRDVNMKIGAGEVIGIIGKNGFGKSKLLKIISRITAPMISRVRVNGRLSILLEVGNGFHGELSGRENIFLNDTIFGMTPSEIRRQFDEIVDLSEIEEFIDTPVKRYSSAMFVRPVFAVAAHLEIDILVADEVLSVDDIGFKRKCFNKISDASANGRTVLFVSRRMDHVTALCSRSVVLNAGSWSSGECRMTPCVSMTAGDIPRSCLWTSNVAACRFLLICARRTTKRSPHGSKKTALQYRGSTSRSIRRHILTEGAAMSNFQMLSARRAGFRRAMRAITTSRKYRPHDRIIERIATALSVSK